MFIAQGGERHSYSVSGAEEPGDPARGNFFQHEHSHSGFLESVALEKLDKNSGLTMPSLGTPTLNKSEGLLRS